MNRTTGWASAVVCTALTMLLNVGCAQATETAPGSWIIAVASGALGEAERSPWRFAVDAQLRHFDIGTGIHEHLVRPALGVALNDSTRIWLGYGRFRSRNESRRVADENRYWQQIDWTGNTFLQGTLTLRARTEQRDISFSGDRRDVLRLMARYQKPLNTSFNGDLFVSVEPFFDLNRSDWGGDKGLSQNRVHLGTGLTLSPKLRLEVGIMQQYFWAENATNRVNYLGMLSARWRY